MAENIKGVLLRRIADLVTRVEQIRGVCFVLDKQCEELEGDLEAIEERLSADIDMYMARRLLWNPDRGDSQRRSA